MDASAIVAALDSALASGRVQLPTTQNAQSHVVIEVDGTPATCWCSYDGVGNNTVVGIDVSANAITLQSLLDDFDAPAFAAPLASAIGVASDLPVGTVVLRVDPTTKSVFSVSVELAHGTTQAVPGTSLSAGFDSTQLTINVGADALAPRVRAMLFGTITVGHATFSAVASYPGMLMSASLQHGSTLELADAVRLFGGDPTGLPAVQCDAASLAARPDGSYVDGSFSLSSGPDIAPGGASAVSTRWTASISRTAGSSGAHVDTVLTGQVQLGQSTFSASWSSASEWTLAARIARGSLSSIISAAAAAVGALTGSSGPPAGWGPLLALRAPAHTWPFEMVTLSYDHASGHYGLVAMASQDLQLDLGNATLTVSEAALAIEGGDGAPTAHVTGVGRAGTLELDLTLDLATTGVAFRASPQLHAPALTLGDVLSSTVSRSVLEPVRASTWVQSILGASISDVAVTGDTANAEFGFSCQIALPGVSAHLGIEAFVRRVGADWAFLVVAPGIPLVSLRQMSELAFLSELQPGSSSLALSSRAWTAPPWPSAAGSAPGSLVAGLNFSSSIPAVGPVAYAVQDILGAGGVTSFTLAAEIGVGASFVVEAAVSGSFDFKGAAGLHVSDAGLRLSADAATQELSTAIHATFSLRVPDRTAPLAFVGEVAIQKSGAQFALEGSVATPPGSPAWVDAFGLAGLTLAELGLELAVTSGGAASVGVRVGRFDIGSGANALAGSAAAQFAYPNLSEGMVALTLDRVTLAQIADCFCASAAALAPHADLAGVVLTDATAYVVPTTTEIAGVTYPAGLRLAGALEIFGWSGAIEVDIPTSGAGFSTPTAIHGFAYLDPIPSNGAGFLVLTRAFDAPPGGSFPTFPTLPLLPPPQPDGARLALQITPGSQSLLASLGVALLGSLNGSAVATITANSYAISFSTSASDPTYGVVSAHVDLAATTPDMNDPSKQSEIAYGPSNATLAFDVSTTVGPISAPGESGSLFESVAVDATVSATLSYTLSGLPTPAFSGSLGGSLAWRGNTLSMPSLSLGAQAPTSLGAVLSAAESLISGALSDFFRSYANFEAILSSGTATLAADATQLGDALQSLYSLSATQAARALRPYARAAYVGSMLRGTYDQSASEAASTLDEAGYTADQAAAALNGTFVSSGTDLYNALASAYGKTAAGKATAGLFPHWHIDTWNHIDTPRVRLKGHWDVHPPLLPHGDSPPTYTPAVDRDIPPHVDIPPR